MHIPAGLTHYVSLLTVSIAPAVLYGGARLMDRRTDRRTRRRLTDWARQQGLLILSCTPRPVDRSPFWIASSTARVYELRVRDTAGREQDAWVCLDGEAGPAKGRLEAVVAEAIRPGRVWQSR
jgi:hypothetical protein